MIGICKFCKCSEFRPCLIPTGNPLQPVLPCGWLLEDVCSNPECVKKAYAEACQLVDRLIITEAA